MAAPRAGATSSAPTISASSRPADVEIVRALGVRSAFDFRGVEERAAGVCVVNEITVHSLPIEPTVVAALRAEPPRAR